MMHSFVLFLKCGFYVTVAGKNMIDACYRFGSGCDYKEVMSYREDLGPLIQFSK